MYHHHPNVSYNLTQYRLRHDVYTLLGGAGVRNAIYVNNTSDPADPTGHLFQVLGSRSTAQWSSNTGAAAILPLSFCSPEGRSMRHVGWVLQGGCVERIRDVCAGVPPPPQQLPGSEPLGSCREWTEEVIDALFGVGVLEQLRPSKDSGDTLLR